MSIVGTSTTSNTLIGGSHTFVTQPGKSFQPGSFITVVSRANPAVNWMWGQVLEYDPVVGTLVMTAQVTGGSGTFTDWTLMISGARGAQGVQGPQGVPGPAGGAGPPTGSAGGDLTENYPSPKIGNVKVTTAKIADRAVTPIKIAVGTNGQFLQTAGGAVVWGTGPSVAPTVPGGTDGAIQYKQGTTFAGNAAATVDAGGGLKAAAHYTPLGGKIGNLGVDGSVTQGNGGYIWSAQFYNIWQVEAAPGTSIYYSIEQRRYYHNATSMSGVQKNGAMKLDYNIFELEVTPYAPQANFTVVVADILNTSSSREVAAVEGLDRITALKPSSYTLKVPMSEPVKASDIDEMTANLEPGEGPDFAKFPGFADDMTRHRIRQRRTTSGRGFIAEEFAEIYPELVHTDLRGNKGIGLDMDFYADLVASIKALKARVEELEGKVGTA